MAAIGEDLLKLNIKERKFSPVYLFYGEEDFMKKYYLDRIKKKAVGEAFPDFNLHQIDGTKTDINEIMQLAMSVPMMNDFVLTVVNDFDFSGVDEKKINELFYSLEEGSILLFYSQTVKPSQKSGWKLALKRIKELGCVVKFDKKDSRDLAKIAISAAKKRGCYFPQYLATSFIERVGTDLNLIKNEVDKLCAMKGSGDITAEDIDKICVRTLDASAFDLTKALIASNPNKVFDILNDLYDRRQEPIMILGAVSSAYIDMYRVKVAQEKGLDVGAVANFYSYKADWKLKRAAYNAKNLSLSQLRRSVNVLCESDELLKSFQSDPTVVLDESMMKLMLIAARKTNA